MLAAPSITSYCSEKVYTNDFMLVYVQPQLSLSPDEDPGLMLKKPLKKVTLKPVDGGGFVSLSTSNVLCTLTLPHGSKLTADIKTAESQPLGSFYYYFCH